MPHVSTTWKIWVLLKMNKGNEQTNARTHSTFNMFNVQYSSILPYFHCAYSMFLSRRLKADGSGLRWHKTKSKNDLNHVLFSSFIFFIFNLSLSTESTSVNFYRFRRWKKITKKGKFDSFNFHAFYFHPRSLTILCVLSVECEWWSVCLKRCHLCYHRFRCLFRYSKINLTLNTICRENINGYRNGWQQRAKQVKNKK